jgi:hypothetical protein
MSRFCHSAAMRKDKAHFLSSLSFLVVYAGIMATLWTAAGAYVGDSHWGWIVLSAAALAVGFASTLYFDRKWMR